MKRKFTAFYLTAIPEDADSVQYTSQDAGDDLLEAIRLANAKDVFGEGHVGEYVRDRRAEGGWYQSAIYDHTGKRISA